MYAEPVFEGFTEHTGIKVRAVYDSEAVKTVGLVNRLLAEKSNPQCDVFWNNEELRTRQLERSGVLRETDPWAPFGFRKRQLVINTNQLNNPDCPRTLLALTNASCRGKIAIAYPLFGTTATHFLALRQSLGELEWEKWCRALVANKPLLLDGNSVVVKMVGSGEAWIGLTDSDDIKAGAREGMPVQAIDLEEHGFLIRNTVSVIRNAPHPARAQALFEFLQKNVVQEVLKEAGASEGQLTREIAAKTQEPDWNEILRTQEAAVQKLKEIFLR
ncbi:MAG: substrate-binding domain-containing protein [Verrucomicrobia bacterium]|nr:substrate-binding domain-containing protein [Verrucomicrobiota bacterium]